LLAVLGAGAAPATADPQGQVGTAEDPLRRLYAEDVVASRVGTPSTPTRATVDRLVNAVGDARIQVGWDGLVVPVAAGLGLADAIDPSETDTPIADARDVIKAEANTDGGRILLPPGERLTEAATLDGLGRIEIRGSRSRPTIVEFTDLSSDAIRVDGTDDGTGVYIDGVVIDGSDRENRTGGSAIHFTGAVPFFNLGRVTVRNWVDPVIHMDTGHPFESDWEQVYGTRYEGRLLFVEDAGEPLEIRTLIAGPESPGTSVHIEYPGGDVRISKLAHRADKFADRALLARQDLNSMLSVDTIHFETSMPSVVSAVRLQGRGSTTIGDLRVVDVVGDSVIDVQPRCRRKNVPQPVLPGSDFANLVKVTADLAGPLRYRGPASDLTNTSGTSPLSYPVDCYGSNFWG
jgi:hypothetical protein